MSIESTTERVCPECGRILQTRSDRKGLVCYRCGYRVEFLGCAKHGFNFRDDCDACQTTEPQTEPRVCDLSPLEAPQGETHGFEFTPFDGQLCGRMIYGNGGTRSCGQPADAPVHKVASDPHSADDACALCQKPMVNPTIINGVFGAHAECLERERLANNPPLAHPSAEPPARVWINLPDNQVNSRASVFEHKHFDDDIAYAHLAPIRAALEKCRVSEKRDYNVINKSDWDALVATIKGE
jgi:DNA-directed RNA polymerase subunit RPC12/RpoP